MDSLKIIPQMFFDFIARVVPGLTTIIIFGIALNTNLLVKLLEFFLESPHTPDKSPFLAITVILGASYMVGVIIEPVGKATRQKIASRCFKYTHPLLDVINDKDDYLPSVKEFLLDELKTKSDSQVKDAIWVWYDWLRINLPYAGALTAKLRAEYTMYSSLSATFGIALLTHIASAASLLDVIRLGPKTNWDPGFMVITLLVFLLSMLRSTEVLKTFRLSVINLYFSGKEKVNREIKNRYEGQL